MQAGDSVRDSHTICINNRNICILHYENETRIFYTKDVKFNVEELLRKTRNSLGNQQEWPLTQIRDIYNDLIKSSTLIQMVQYILASSIFTLNIKHPKEEIKLNKIFFCFLF